MQGGDGKTADSLTCPSCGARLRVRSRLSGQSVPCPRCRTPLDLGPPPADDLEDLAASILSGEDTRPAPSAAPRPAAPASPPRRAAPPPQGARLLASQRAEKSLQAILALAEERGDKVAYLLALTYLTDINRLASDGALVSEKVSPLVRQFGLDGGKDEHVRNCLIAGGAHIPPGSRLTLREAYDLFRKQCG
jgi:hypothetical protein